MNQPQKQLNVLLLGDSCIDEYCLGTVSRLSPEAPIPILDFKGTTRTMGMAGNVYSNLINLGCNVEMYVGDAGVKKRFIDRKTNQQLLRVDVPSDSKIQFIQPPHKEYDLVVISDYDKGFLTYENIKTIIEAYKCPIFIDTKKTDASQFEGCYVKINSLERSRLTSTCSNLIVTHGGDKVVFNGKEYKVPTVEAFDVCGAGDTFLAALAVEFVKSNNWDTSIKFAMAAAAITVRHLGVYAPTIEEIDNEINR